MKLIGFNENSISSRSTDDFNGAQCKAVCVEAGMIAIRQGRGYIKQEDFIDSVKRINLKKIKGGLKDSPDTIYN